MAKLLLYLTNNQLTSTIWEKGGLSATQSFDHYETGWAKFSAYLQTLRETPAFLLTDLIEEDFQRENIPHVFGSAKRNLIERRLLSLYRDTPYSTASFQGRETEGRKDDQVLFSALTNPILLKPWLDVLQKTKTDVAGIYSVPLLSPLLFKKLNMGKEPVLLVTHQSSGLRQSYFHSGQLRFSRLAPETAWSPQAIAEMTDSEMAKTRQFLASTRLLARGAAIDIVIVAAREVMEHLRPLCPDMGGLRYRFIELNQAPQVFGVAQNVEMLICDPLFLSLLGNQRVASHYATLEQTRSHYFSQIKIGLNAVSVVSVSLALLWAANDGFDAYQATQLAQQAKFDTRTALARYQATLTSMPVTVANPHDMRSAVDVGELIEKNAPSPLPLLVQLSEALETLPQIKVHGLNWEVSEGDGSASALAPTLATGETPPILATVLGIPKRPVEVLSLECEVLPFKNDYRSALEQAQQLLQRLQQDSRIQASLTKPPIDIRTSSKLESQAGDDAALAKPQFTVRIVWSP